jgi:hypothetical protein
MKGGVGNKEGNEVDESENNEDGEKRDDVEEK